MKYFDHAATTPPYEEVIDTITEVMKQHYGNPSSLHQYGLDSAKLLQMARKVCADAMHIAPEEVIFTSSATESNNLAIKGAAIEYRSRGRHIVTTMIEHPSVYECCRQLEQLGYEITFVPVDERGKVSADRVLQAVRKDTVLVSVMQVNNETGSIQPIEQIGRRLKKEHPKVIFHVDGVQGFGKLPLLTKEAGVDLYSISAHKFRGPKGAGLLVVRKGIRLFPLLAGGGQEAGLRSGTENLPNVVGMAKAVRLAAHGQKARAKQWQALRELLIQGIGQQEDLVLNSNMDGAPHIVNFSFPGMKAEVLLHSLEQSGMLVSTKSACSSKRSEPSRVLLAMGKDMDTASSGIRISLGEEHTEKDIRELLAALSKAVSSLRGLKGGV